MMELETLHLPATNKLMEAYRTDEQFIHTFFDYDLSEQSYVKRLEELDRRSFQRSELASVITQFMEPFGISENARRHIQELADDAVAVIGGQQAGILTGPLYSVHKAITVVLQAKEQREKLGKAVVPVFWVAGEDHDLNEINHVFTEREGSAVKRQFKQPFVLKQTASDATYDAKELTAFVKKIFKSYGETAFTRKLLKDVLQAVESEQTFTTFFVRLMNDLFKDYGLLFIDAAYKPLRELESSYFVQMIENAKAMAEQIYDKEQRLLQLGLGQPIGAEPDDANLFYVHETGRILLKRNEDRFVNESAGLSLSRQELLRIAYERPWLLSNNVATRPIMQDFVFPVLSFVGGPGEIAYWAVLKEAFHQLGIQMPIVFPRLSMTIVTRQAQEALRDTNLQIEETMDGTLENEREQWLRSLQNEQFHELLAETEDQLNSQYEKLEQLLKAEDPAVLQVLHKNLQFHKQQFDFLRKKKEQSLKNKHAVQLRKYEILTGELYPNGSLQERIYTPYYLMNQYGEELIDDLLELPFTYDGSHQVVYL